MILAAAPAGVMTPSTGDPCANAVPEQRDACYKEQVLQRNLYNIQQNEAQQSRTKTLLIGGGIAPAVIVGALVFRKR
jgi:hypothetical protein